MQTILLDATIAESTAIAQAAQALRAGDVVAFPTETVYGLGADAFNADAVANVFAAKGRPADNPLIVHVALQSGFERCALLSPRAERLIQALTPGPLTLVLPSRPEVPAIVRAGLPTVAVRMPDHPVAHRLLLASGPLVAPSANRSGRPSPTTAQHVLDDLSGRIAAVLDGGPCRVGIESTVIDLSGAAPVLLRAGAVSPEAIAEVLGQPVIQSTTNPDAPRSPGMKYRHYAPSVPLRIHVGAFPQLPADGKRRLLLTNATPFPAIQEAHVEPLSEATFYQLLRHAEGEGMEEIIVHLTNPNAVSAGLLDRITKAAGGESPGA
ncbi:MAG: threonylcarbamoyl-AMP synthase [Chlorobi bacterium]|nr:threonylcarbamoyl-AMP synthase [Chlorobiota bacterium]MBX7217217.1 threonylcarbamoyl-AMP synthase [Candidatus Kapabacteria bacterium]